jgi:hypothetical protein
MGSLEPGINNAAVWAGTNENDAVTTARSTGRKIHQPTNQPTYIDTPGDSKKWATGWVQRCNRMFAVLAVPEFFYFIAFVGARSSSKKPIVPESHG